MKTLELKPARFSQAFSVRAAGDEASRVLTFTIATERVALDDGVLLADGADFARYLENPIVFSDHKGTCESKVGRTIAIRRIDGGWESDIEFAPPEVSEDAEEVFQFLKWAGFGAVSIGFIVTKMNRDPSAELRVKYALPKYGWIGETWQLLETSVVGVGADPGALAHMAGPNGRAMRQAYTEAFLRKWEATKTTTTDVRMAEPVVATETATGENPAAVVARNPEPVIARQTSTGDNPSELKIGDRVKVADGKEHEPDNIGISGTVAEIGSQAIGIKFDGMKEIHHWYVAEELVPGDTEDSEAQMGHAATPPTVETESPDVMDGEDPSQSENDQTSLMFSMVFEAIQQLNDKLDSLCEQKSAAAVATTEEPRSAFDWDKLEEVDKALSRLVK